MRYSIQFGTSASAVVVERCSSLLSTLASVTLEIVQARRRSYPRKWQGKWRFQGVLEWMGEDRDWPQIRFLFKYNLFWNAPTRENIEDKQGRWLSVAETRKEKGGNGIPRVLPEMTGLAGNCGVVLPAKNGHRRKTWKQDKRKEGPNGEEEL